MKTELIRKAKLFYSSLPWFRQLMTRLSNSPLYFYWLKHHIAHQKEKDKQGPFNLVIETSNFCNARCLMCPHRIMQRSQQIMTKEIFGLIVKRIKEEKLPINKVFFSGMGEPLTDPHLLLRLEAIKKMGLWVRLYTNASLMTQAIAEKLVMLGIDEINISFNGTNPKEYRQIMGLDFARTVKNIDQLLAIKKKMGRAKPFIQISSVVLEENEKHIRQHVEKWQQKVESVTVSLAHQWGGAVAIKSGFSSIRSKTKRVYPCRSLWHTFVLDNRGNFVICCRDYESRYILGNIKTHSFADIQKSRLLQQFRQAHLQYRRSALPAMCQKCNFPYQNGLEWLLPRSID